MEKPIYLGGFLASWSFWESASHMATSEDGVWEEVAAFVRAAQGTGAGRAFNLGTLDFSWVPLLTLKFRHLSWTITKET